MNYLKGKMKLKCKFLEQETAKEQGSPHPPGLQYLIVLIRHGKVRVKCNKHQVARTVGLETIVHGGKAGRSRICLRKLG